MRLKKPKYSVAHQGELPRDIFLTLLKSRSISYCLQSLSLVLDSKIWSGQNRNFEKQTTRSKWQFLKKNCQGKIQIDFVIKLEREKLFFPVNNSKSWTLYICWIKNVWWVWPSWVLLQSKSRLRQIYFWNKNDSLNYFFQVRPSSCGKQDCFSNATSKEL